MIIFTPIKDIPRDLIDYKGIKILVKFNLSSYYTDIPTMNHLIPMNNLPEDVLSGDYTGTEFDNSYHNYIINNNDAFMQFMAIISTEYTYSNEVLIQILIDHSNFRDAVSESLMKLIQQRYGHNSYYVNDIEDFMYISPQDFTIPGLFILDRDMARLRSMMPIDDEGDDVNA